MKYNVVLQFALLILLPTYATAEHLIGATMHYSHTVGSQYDFELRVTRDCQEGTKVLDDTVSIGLFDPSNQLVLTLRPLLHSAETYFFESGVCWGYTHACIEEGSYLFSIDIGANLNGWSVVYMRCCRLINLVNIIHPDGTGMTLQTVISTDEFNHGAEIRDTLFKIAIVDSPFFYDVSTTDADGDSLVYSLITPFSGAEDSIRPNRPLDPPYYFLPWYNPPFSQNNMMGGTYPLKIHPQTGLISALPSIIGTFQIGYRISEYRNGILIGFRNVDQILVVDPPTKDGNKPLPRGTAFLHDYNLVDHGRATLLEHRLTDDSLFVLAEQDLINGFYDFGEIPGKALYIKAEPTVSSIAYQHYAPTYWPRSVFWYGAEIVTQCELHYPFEELALIPLSTISTGSYTVSGTIDRVRTSSPPTNATILLMQGDSVAGYGHVDENGAFEIGNLAAGHYDVFVDALNTSVYNTSPPQIEVMANTILTTRLHDTALEILHITSTFNQVIDHSNNFFAYFHSKDLVIESSVQHADERVIHMHDIRGQLIQSFLFPEMEFSVRFQCREIPSGLYFLSVSQPGRETNLQYFRVVKP